MADVGVAGATRSVRRDAAPPRLVRSGPEVVRLIHGQIGNQAAVRLTGAARLADAPGLKTPVGAHPRAGVARLSRAAARQPDAPVQRLLTVKDPEGAEYTKETPGFASEAHYAIRENESLLSSKDPDDFNGVYGNFLENSGIFASYLTKLYDSGKNYGMFDLSKASDVVDLYFALKPLVMLDVGAEPEDADPQEAALDPDFTPDKILFASVSGGKVGSIYFPAGRIRLVHDKGPEISKHANIERYTVSEADYQRYQRYKDYRDDPRYQRYYSQWATGRDYVVQHLGSCQVATAGTGDRLLEFWTGGSHPSRGGPSAFNWALSQKQLNIVYTAATSKANATLRLAMAGDRLLSQIPIN